MKSEILELNNFNFFFFFRFFQNGSCKLPPSPEEISHFRRIFSRRRVFETHIKLSGALKQFERAVNEHFKPDGSQERLPPPR